jgi:methyl-accepting chemotaxis protein
VKAIFEDAAHAWMVVIGFLLGVFATVIGIAAAVKRLHRLVDRLNETIAAAEKATHQARALSQHVATEYQTVLRAAKDLQEEMKGFRRALSGDG